ncbi:MAG: hypothetical protein ACYSTF_06150 [Planctomycetota bacterium]|jgi:hypothetical protein
MSDATEALYQKGLCCVNRCTYARSIHIFRPDVLAYDLSSIILADIDEVRRRTDMTMVNSRRRVR